MLSVSFREYSHYLAAIALGSHSTSNFSRLPPDNLSVVTNNSSVGVGTKGGQVLGIEVLFLNIKSKS